MFRVFLLFRVLDSLGGNEEGQIPIRTEVQHEL